MWNYDPPTPDERSKLANTTAISGFTQGDYTSLCKAKARLIFHSLYPVEQGFLCSKFPALQPNDKDGFFTSLWKDFFRHLDRGGFDNLLRKVLSKIIYNMTGERYREIVSQNHSYFEDLKKEHQKFVVQSANHKKIDGMPADVRVIRGYTELKQLLQINTNYEIGSPVNNTVCVIFCVEGGHSLGCGQKNTILADDIHEEINLLNNIEDPQTMALLTTLKNNIRSLKKMGPKGVDDDGSHCPFYITLSHHFWNQLCGSAMSYADPANKVFDQLRGLATGFTEAGKVVLDELLSKENGNRILIDIKHMSHQSRTFFYKYLEEKRAVENIPIIASHMGVTGMASYDENSYPARNVNVPADMDAAYNNNKGMFNVWDINLFDDDIINIHLSGGIIGLNFDQRILSGKLLVTNMTKISNDQFGNIFSGTDDDLQPDEIDQRKKDVVNSVLYRAIWSQPIVENIMHIVKTISSAGVPQKELAWERICIGSDFDGLINALDAYCHAEDFLVLRTILVKKFTILAQYEPVLESKNVEELVDGFMYKNLFKFLERHF
jgi:hypothetical protein